MSSERRGEDFDLPTQLGGGRYFLRQLIGRGGAAQVAAAFDVRQGRACAIKMVPTNSYSAKRFLTEAEVLAQIRHPNVVPIWDFGEEVGLDYLVMPLFQTNLLSWIKRHGPLDLKRTAEVMDAMLAGLQAVHDAEVVHRDVKPSNVLMDDGMPVLADLGIARVEGGTGTSSGMVLGSKTWRAPEQELDAKRVDVRADVYGAGATLFYVVTGKRPGLLFAASRTPEMLELVPESARDIIVRATAFKPDERYGDIDELRGAISALA